MLIGNIIEVMGVYLVSTHKLEFNISGYIISTAQYLESNDVIIWSSKSSCIWCYNRSYELLSWLLFIPIKGLKGVENATTSAVISLSILILISDYLITEIFFR